MFAIYRVVPTILLCIAIAGCGSKTDNKTSSAAPSLDTALSPKTVEKVQAATLPKADRSTPLSSYQDVTSGNQLMFLYYGISNMPPDMIKVATAYSNEYRSTNDGFRKQDILNALKPRITSEIERAKASRYVKYTINGRPIEKYDFSQHAFPFGGAFDNGSYYYFSDNSIYRLGFTNGDSFKSLKVADESKAREIENLLSSYRNMRLVIYAFAQDVDPNSMLVKAEIVSVKLLDERGNELATQ